MNKIIKHHLVIIFITVVTILNGCKKETVPVVTTTSVTAITGTSAVSGGNITDEGSSTVTSRGVCWSTGTTPTIADSKTTDGAGVGSFSSNLTVLNGATNYYVRAYAVNSVGTGYGMAVSFTTLGQSPTPSVASASNITVTSATLNGTVNANYLPTVVTFEYGLTASYGSTITATQSPLTGNTSTNISADITGLTAGTIYHYRTKAVNSLGTTYSDDISFTTLGKVPTITTQEATNITMAGAQINGMVNPNFFSTVITFEYGITISYGNTVPATQSPLTGGVDKIVSASISALAGGVTYHFRAKAVNSLGTSYGGDKTFTTLGKIPTVTTQAVTNKTTVGAQLNGTAKANYIPTEVTFEYGITNSYGNKVTATQSPITGSTNTNVNAILTGLTVATIYHYRIVATNSLGTTNGGDMTFTTLGQVPTVTTMAATSTTTVAAQLNGSINANYLETTVTFEYGTTTNYGSTVTSIQSPVTGNMNTDVSVNISGLISGSTYHFRVKAVNSLGSTYGSDMTFTAAYAIGGYVNGGIVFYIDGTGQHGLVCAPSDQSTGAAWDIAAQLCQDLVLNTYDDWYLPSKDELGLMYTNLKANGFGGFNSHWYWSSTLYAYWYYWYQDFGSGLKDGGSKYSEIYVRAIRAF